MPSGLRLAITTVGDLLLNNTIVNEKQINCLGNYARIGSEANSQGSNWSPKSKLDYYLDASKKIPRISVASLKHAKEMKGSANPEQNGILMI